MRCYVFPAILVLTVTGCGRPESPRTANTARPSASEEKEIELCQSFTGVWRADDGHFLNFQIDEQGAHLDGIASDWAVDTEKNAIVLWPAEARNKDIWVVLFRTEEPSTIYCGYRNGGICRFQTWNAEASEPTSQKGFNWALAERQNDYFQDSRRIQSDAWRIQNGDFRQRYEGFGRPQSSRFRPK